MRDIELELRSSHEIELKLRSLGPDRDLRRTHANLFALYLGQICSLPWTDLQVYDHFCRIADLLNEMQGLQICKKGALFSYVRFGPVADL